MPLAAVSWKDSTRYALAILCDEGDEDVPAFEQHVHRPLALTTRRWTVARVAARDWLRNPEPEPELARLAG